MHGLTSPHHLKSTKQKDDVYPAVPFRLRYDLSFIPMIIPLAFSYINLLNYKQNVTKV